MRLSGFFYFSSIQVQLFLCLFISIFIPINTQANTTDSYLNEKKRQSILTIQQEIYLDHFILAARDADSLITQYPEDPLGYLFKAGAYLSEMTDAEEDLYPDRFQQLIDTTITLANLGITSPDDRTAAWMYLWLGHARAYRSLYESRFGSFTTALRNGFKAKSAYEDGLTKDSTLYDLYGGLGMYHYWKSAKAGFLRWIRIFSNDKKKGIDELYLTIDSSSISRDAARAALIWIYIDKGEYDSSLAISKEMFQKYPEGKTFLWSQGEAYFKAESYQEAIGIYGQLRDRLVESPGNYYNLVEADYRIVKSYQEMKQDKEAKMYAKKIMDYVNDIPEETRAKQKGKINKMIKLANHDRF